MAVITTLIAPPPARAQSPNTTPQSQSQPRSVSEQALIQKLMEEINSNLQLRGQIVQLQAQIEELQKPKPAEPEKKSDAEPQHDPIVGGKSPDEPRARARAEPGR